MNSIDLRWLAGQLEIRHRPFVVDASGAFCGLGEWGEWHPIPDITEAFIEALAQDTSAAPKET